MAVGGFRRECASDHPRNIQKNGCPFLSNTQSGGGVVYPNRIFLFDRNEFLLASEEKEEIFSDLVVGDILGRCTHLYMLAIRTSLEPGAEREDSSWTLNFFLSRIPGLHP